MRLVRAGDDTAFEALVGRYRARLLAFCRHMLGGAGEAEDLLQEVLTAAYGAMRQDERPLDVRPWLYQIARNRCLNHLRQVRARGGVAGPELAPDEAIETRFADGGSSTADRAVGHDEFRMLIDDLLGLVETQRTAIVLRELEGLSYEQVADTMDTSVSGVKSLLIRARAGLVEAAEARELRCEEVRLELAGATEGLGRPSAAARSHAKRCAECAGFRKRLRRTDKALAAIAPFWPFATLKGLLVAKAAPAVGTVGAGAAGGSAAAVPAGASALAIATKAAFGLATVAAIAAGGVPGIDPPVNDSPTVGADAPVLSLPDPALQRQEPAHELVPQGIRNEGEQSGRAEGETAPVEAARPAGEIVSSTPERVPGVTPTEPGPREKLTERLPGTTDRGRPAPGGMGLRRTRPAPGTPYAAPAPPPEQTEEQLAPQEPTAQEPPAQEPGAGEGAAAESAPAEESPPAEQQAATAS